ncbi:MAG: helix-hairpin-helix domain-containing protein [Cyclobacteriaceae bacterium]|nr:helix-hairpin-helix domain-containing protein [Cyclobacteriaceae bacterium]
MFRQFYQFVRIFLRRSLGYSSTEARAFIVLNMLIIFVLMLPLFFEKYYTNQRWLSEDDLDKLDSLIEKMSLDHYPVQKNNYLPLAELSALNPNQTHFDTLLLSGLHRRAAENLVKYREKGGKFRSVDDLYKIYGMDSAWVTQNVHILYFLDPDDLKQTNNSFEKARSKLINRKKTDIDAEANVKTANDIEKIDINRADAEALISLPGIGEILSDRIVKYRNLLGGFVDVNQLNDVYGVKEETIIKILPLIYISDDFNPRKINLNTTPLYYLKRHPYITEKLAVQIDSLRKITKPLDSIQVVDVIISSESEKVLPYIGF